MNRRTLSYAFPAALITGVAALQGTGSVGVARAANLYASGSLTFKGPVEDTRHGPVGASIVVKSRKIVKLGSTISPNEDGRSPFLQSHAVPILKAEALKAQSAKIQIVSGATETSEAYIQSLGSAIKKARKVGALK